jgi:hypothetical protein
LQEIPIDCLNPVAPNQPYEINADFANVVFDREGEWIFELRANGQLLSIRSLQVSIL